MFRERWLIPRLFNLFCIQTASKVLFIRQNAAVIIFNRNNIALGWCFLALKIYEIKR